MSKLKTRRELKVAREKQCVTYKGTPQRLSDFSAETSQDRKVWHDVFKVLKEKIFPAENTLTCKVIIQK